MGSVGMVREARPEDVPRVWQLILCLAEYERLSHAVQGNAQTLADHLFSENPTVGCLVVEDEGEVVGYAIYFLTFSTFLTKTGIWLEDLFVMPEHRGKGFGKALLIELARIARQRDYGRVEWSVLDWNQPSIDFYKSLGARMLEDWNMCRLDVDSLAALGAR